MKKLFQLLSVVVCFFLLDIPSIIAQGEADNSVSEIGRLSYTKTFGSYRAEMDGETLSKRKLFHLLDSKDASAHHLRKFKSQKVLAMLAGGVGGFVAGYPLGMFMAGGEKRADIFIVGAAFVALSIPIGFSARKDLKRAMDAYNSSLTTSYKGDPGSFNLCIFPGGMGVAWRF